MSTTNKLGIRQSNAIVPFSAATKRTKQYALTFSSTPSGWSLTSAYAVAYADSAGVWWMDFIIDAAMNSATSANVTVDGVTFAAGFQALTTVAGSSSASYAYTGNAAAGVIYITHEVSQGGFIVSGTARLASEPTWAATNMESYPDVSVYIPPASGSTPGLVDGNAQSWSGVKTFNDGIKVDDAAGQSTLNYYSTQAATSLGTITNTTGGSGKYVATRIGALVTLTLRFTTGTSTGAYVVSGTAIDAAYRPTNELWVNVGEPSLSDESEMWLQVGTSGLMALYRYRRDTNGDFVAVNMNDSTAYYATISFVQGSLA